MRRIVIAAYSLFSYLFFLGTFLYLIGFVWGIAVPKGIDDGQSGSVAGALATNTLLLVIFGLQHSIMARPSFKAWWTTLIPKPAERSTYVLMASAVTALLMWGWQPSPYVLWDVDGSVAGMGLFAISALGWGIVLLSTFQVDHFALFGLKQGAYYLLRRRLPAPDFVVRGLYHLVRHPLMLGFIIAFWFTPRMTVAHLEFALGMTVYILLALEYEERDLVHELGEQYAAYQRRTPRLNPIRIP